MQPLDDLLVPLVVGVHQLAVEVPRELGVDGQPHHPALFRAGETDSVLHHIPASGAGGNVCAVLLWGQDLLQDGPQLNLPQNTAGFDVGEDLFQVPHAGGQGLHLSQALVNLLELIADLLKGLAQPLLQGFLQLFVYRFPDSAQLVAVVLLDGV